MLRIGIIGAGDFGAHHARAIARLDDVRLVAACRTDDRLLREFTGRYGGSGYTDYRQLLADKTVDAVVIATPHHRHCDIAAAAAQAGKHILLEKPMATTLAECDGILAAARQSGVKLMVAHISHFVPAVCVAQRLLRSGDIGDPVYAHSTMIRPWMTANRQPWHLDRASGGGMWLTIGVHVLDQLCWLMDSPATSVAAQLQTRFHEQAADDTGIAFLRFANNATATASTVGYRTGVTCFVTEVVGTGGILRIDHQAGVTLGRDETWQPIAGSASNHWMDDALTGEWQAFAAAIEHDAPLPVTGEYGREIMKVALAAEQSSRRQAEVEVD